ncbi:MAG: hypothetical protein GTN80_05725 [Nitrososphaeria archaeon]|nr:hypothetical protein [Nitrososphaeria archaeon]NIN52648.1 hypothetical protein [Nitrososphaeria archaeon]NIQ33123.1 hypothetical protein [Nitrososphaeria archaeon]
MDEEALKKAANHLRGGAKLTSKTCPLCGFLLLEKDSKYYCSRCEREMIFTETREEYVRLSSELVLSQLKELLIRRIDFLRREIEVSSESLSLLKELDQYLSILGKVEGLMRYPPQLGKKAVSP